MSDHELKEINKRVQALEKRGGSWRRHALQFLLAPVLVIAFGYFINLKLEEKKAEVTQLQLAQEILPTLFSEDPHQGFAAQRLMRHVLEDSLSEEIGSLVTSYYLNRLKTFSNRGDNESASRIRHAAESVGGALGMQFVEEVNNDTQLATKLNEYDQAVVEERKGFQNLIDGKYDEAIAAFEAANLSYPQFHQVYEIGVLLKKNRERLNNPAFRRSVFRQIVREMSWKAPSDLLELMRQKVEGSG